MINKTLENNLPLETQIIKCIDKYFNNRTYIDSVDKLVKKIKSSVNESEKNEYQYPLFINWVITADCNLRCKHCYYYNNEKKYDASQDISTKRAMEVIDDIEKLNIIQVVITGGEPLLRNDIFDIIAKLKSKNIAVRLSTNATLVTNDIAIKLSNLLNPLMDSIQISLDGATALSHEKVRGKNSFEKTITGIRNLVNNGFIPYINCTVTSENIFELVDMYNLVKKLGLQRLTLSKILPSDETHNNLYPDINTLFLEVAKVIELEEQNNGPFFEMSTFKVYDFVNHEVSRKILNEKFKDFNNLKTDDNGHFSCHYSSQIAINKDGKIYPCFTAANMNLFSFGDLTTDSLLNIWENRHNNEFFKERPIAKMPCKKCQYFQPCKGGCPLDMYLKHKTLLVPNINCTKGQSFSSNTRNL